jgi:alpha-L-rhamnosidase
MTLTIHTLSCEYQTNPIGIDVARPRLSWQLDADRRGVQQPSYRLLAADSLEVLAANKGNLWNSGRVTTNQSHLRQYKGTDLQSRQRVYWKVIVWDERDQRSEWSEPAFWEMGLLTSSDWQADWITPGYEEDKNEMQPCPLLRTEFDADEGVQTARVYATALGTYELHLNGRRVGDDYFTPGWTSYHNHLQYQTYDVTEHITSGRNAMGALLADGWYRGHLANFAGPSRHKYGDTLALLVQLEIVYDNGRVQTITTNPDWRSSDSGPIRHADHYMGEHYDARLAKPDWAKADFDDSDWAGTRLHTPHKSNLVAQVGTPVRKMHEIHPIALTISPAGETIVDFGQNMVGWVRLQVEGERGTAVTLRHAEILDQEGNLYTINLRAAEQVVTYILKGDGEEVYEPRFTFQGFRYVAVEGYPGELTLANLTGVVLYSDMAATGQFECSHPLVNQLQQNIVWGQRGNFLEVPTDCPQRDERLGWTGDAQVFGRTACFNMDVANFFTRWLRALADDQRADGAVPHVIPHMLQENSAGATGWADAAVIVPWTLYQCFGDKRVLAENYPTMQRWVAFMHERAGADHIWSGDKHFGDWLATDNDEYLGRVGLTDTDLIATAYFAYSTGLLAKIARILRRDEEAEVYEQLATAVRQAFCEEYVTANGRIGTNTQTAYVLPLMFDLLPEALRPEAAQRLVANIRKRGNRLSTGFLGTPYLCHVLARFGYLDVAYDLLLQEDCPSWLYPVTKGATTIWERWDGVKADGSFQNAGMNSFNHYAYGAIGEWLYSTVAGLEIDETRPGYKHALIRPRPGGGLTYANASLATGYGRLASHWQLTDKAFTLHVNIPVNTSATVILPVPDVSDVLEGERPLATGNGIKSIQSVEENTLIEVGSGEYVFVVGFTAV